MSGSSYQPAGVIAAPLCFTQYIEQIRQTLESTADSSADLSAVDIQITDLRITAWKPPTPAQNDRVIRL